MQLTSIDTQLERDSQMEFLTANLLSRSALLVRLLVKQVRNVEISRAEGEVLVILGDGPRRVTELAELEGVAQPTMTLLLKRLQERGWVLRQRLVQDGRVVTVTITGAGRKALEAFRADFVKAMRVDLEPLSDEQLAALAAATESLGAFVEILQQRA